MADVRPFRALRFDPALDQATIICPPYDVLTPALRQELRLRSPHNTIHLEDPDEGDGDRYAHAAATLNDWLAQTVLRPDEESAFYIYDQQFSHADRTYYRRAMFARLGLEPWETGIVRPHERTLEPPKRDRLRLLRATRCNISPIFALYRDPESRIGALLTAATEGEPLLDFVDGEGQRHRLWRLGKGQAQDDLRRSLAAESLYLADGHHRYETALTYREERRAAADAWTGEEPENFCLAALTAADDPGLLILPIHRLVQSATPLESALATLDGIFQVELAPDLEGLLTAMGQRSRVTTAVGLAAAESPDLYLLTLLDRDAAADLMPPQAAAWRSVDTAVVQYCILGHALGIDEREIAAARSVAYTEDAAQALLEARNGSYPYAILLNPLPSRQMLSVADAGQRLPQKSTYFYPKLPTGLVLNLLDA